MSFKRIKMTEDLKKSSFASFQVEAASNLQAVLEFLGTF